MTGVQTCALPIYARDINFFTKILQTVDIVNRKVILVVDLNRTNKKLTTVTFCKNIIK